MSSAASTLRLAARRCQCPFPTRRPTASAPASLLRSFTSSAARLEGEPTKDVTPSAPALSPEETSAARLEETISALRHGDLAKQSRQIIHRTTPEAVRRRRPIQAPVKRQKQGFMNMGESPAESIEDPEFEEDDMTSLAHGQLDQHREYREYARLAAWEMPLLSKMAKPFVPPNQKQILRFRYTTYMGEDHPAEKKVVVEFCPDDIPDLTQIQKDKIKKLAGMRFNPETQIVKMSSEMFESQAQNKRYLGDLVDSLVREAKDPKDTFEDIPLDTRHHTFKTKPKFPREWRITPARQAELEAGRRQAVQLDAEKAASGLLVDGVALIQSAHEQAALLASKTLIEEPAMAKGKGGKKLSVRR